MDEGGGAFYGPKISVQARDAIGRTWQVSTIQVDFQMPQRFEMEYVGADNERHQPIMIHRALFGSIERFFAILVEHYAGAFPAWLAPVQVTVLPVADRHDDYAQQLVDRFRADGFRADLVDAHADTLGARVRRCQGREGAVRPRGGRRRRRARHRRREPRAAPTSPSVAFPSTPSSRSSRPRSTPASTREAARMTLDRLWAGWRATYIDEVATQRAPDDDECLFERLAAADPDEALVLARTDQRVRGDERVPVHVGASDGRAAAPRGDARRAHP